MTLKGLDKAYRNLERTGRRQLGNMVLDALFSLLVTYFDRR